MENLKPLKIRYKKCKHCNQPFEVNPKFPLQFVCSPKCAIEKSKVDKEKKFKKECSEGRKAFKLKYKRLPDYIKDLQKVFNAYIRFRDNDLPCISCGTLTCNEWCAGHFHPTTYQYLRFNEDNVNKQCNQYCNMHKRGNLTLYREGLIKKIGIERVHQLDADIHKELRITIPEIKEKIIYYKSLLKIKS